MFDGKGSKIYYFYICAELICDMKFIAYFIGYIVWAFSLLMPRSKKIWVFGSFRGTFADNAKYLFIHVAENSKIIKPVWISYKTSTVKQVRDLGLKAYSIFSIQGLYYALRGGYYFFNAYSSDICYFTSGRAVQVNLWHGVGLKKIEFCIDRGPLYNRYVRKTLKERFYYPQVYHRPDYFLSSTPFQSVKFAQAFRIDEQHCLNIGYPRNDILLASEQERQAYLNRFESDKTKGLIGRLQSYKRVFLYMPTWRESQRKLFAEHLNLEALNKLMLQKDGLLVLKPHANTIVENREVMSHYSNILLLEGGVDIYPLLAYTDVLITDYSSILYDYLLLDNKGVILYLYDYKEYVKDRDFNYPFMENVVGEVACTFAELVAIIERDEYDRSRYGLMRERFWGEYKGRACQSITEMFKNKQ